MEKTHYTYQITNTLTMQYYVGKRSTYAKSFEEDDYFGSSKYVDAAVLEYGIENFDMEPIEYHDTEDDCYDHEAEIVTWDTVADPLCYNRTPGGRKGDEATYKPLVSFDLNGYKMERFDNFTEAGIWLKERTKLKSSSLNLQGAICMCCQGNQKSVAGFQWRYESEVGDRVFIGPVKRKRPNGGHNTSMKLILDTQTSNVFKSKLAAKRLAFPDTKTPNGAANIIKEPRWIKISKDEYKLFKQL